MNKRILEKVCWIKSSDIGRLNMRRARTRYTGVRNGYSNCIRWLNDILMWAGIADGNAPTVRYLLNRRILLCSCVTSGWWSRISIRNPTLWKLCHYLFARYWSNRLLLLCLLLPPPTNRQEWPKKYKCDDIIIETVFQHFSNPVLQLYYQKTVFVLSRRCLFSTINVKENREQQHDKHHSQIWNATYYLSVSKMSILIVLQIILLY